MSKRPKSPPEKKRLSLAKDRRNTCGENDKASRKGIPRSKARSHRRVRRVANEQTGRIEQIDEAKLDAVESTLTTPKLQKGRWRKEPDRPLGEVIRSKRERPR